MQLIFLIQLLKIILILISLSDFTKENLPYSDSTFDVVFSKSVVEHMYYPENIFADACRVLKPNGLMITMCPAWDHNYKIYLRTYPSDAIYEVFFT